MKYTSLILYLLYNIIEKYYSDGEINKKIGDKNMRMYDNIDVLLKKGISASDIFFAINIKDKEDELLTIRILENVEGIEKGELLFLEEVTRIKSKKAISDFKGRVYNALELKELADSKKREHFSWKTLGELLDVYYK